MNRQQFLENIRHTYDTGIQLIEAKNEDYAGKDNPFRNFESAWVAGVSTERAILIRILDKLSRVSNLISKKNVVQDEKIEDTILDAINYLAILKAKLESKVEGHN